MPFVPNVVVSRVRGKDKFSDHIPLDLDNPGKGKVIVYFTENYFDPTDGVTFPPGKGKQLRQGEPYIFGK